MSTVLMLKLIISLTFVEAGKAKSTILKVLLSSFLVFFLETAGSEQIQIAFIGSEASADH
jgi:hypothetical protein